MFNLTVVLIVLSLDAWLWWRDGWQAGVAALAVTALSYLLGHVMMRRDLERAGYVAEYRPDGTGKRRWRIGVKAPPKKVAEADVQWIPPAKL